MYSLILVIGNKFVAVFYRFYAPIFFLPFSLHPYPLSTPFPLGLVRGKGKRQGLKKGGGDKIKSFIISPRFIIIKKLKLKLIKLYVLMTDKIKN